jgi:hypothetical protein
MQILGGFAASVARLTSEGEAETATRGKRVRKKRFFTFRGAPVDKEAMKCVLGGVPT